MATVHFSGTHYAGFDGAVELHLNQPGHYEVSEEKAAQLTTDFPQEFTLVQEGKVLKTTKVEAIQEAAKSDEAPADEPATVADAREPAEAAVESQDADAPAKKGKQA